MSFVTWPEHQIRIRIRIFSTEMDTEKVIVVGLRAQRWSHDSWFTVADAPVFVPCLVPVDVTLLQDHVLFTLLQRQIMSLQPFKVIQCDHHFLLRPRLFLCFLWWGRGWPPSLGAKKHQLKTWDSLIHKSRDAASVQSSFTPIWSVNSPPSRCSRLQEQEEEVYGKLWGKENKNALYNTGKETNSAV